MVRLDQTLTSSPLPSLAEEGSRRLEGNLRPQGSLFRLAQLGRMLILQWTSANSNCCSTRLVSVEEEDVECSWQSSLLSPLANQTTGERSSGARTPLERSTSGQTRRRSL